MSHRADAVAALLVEAEQAHGVYEATELGGVYDREWARWYAAYAVEHGIGELLDRPIEVDRLAEELAAGFAAFEQADPSPAEPWSAYLARRMVEGDSVG